MSDDGQAVLLDTLLRRPVVVTCDSLAQWLPVWRAAIGENEQHGPYAAAIDAASRADRMAWAFFSGNQGAVQSAFPVEVRDRDVVAAFCANETGRKLTAIATSLRESNDGVLLDGSKSWALAEAVHLYVLARAASGPASGPGSLRVVRVLRTAPGVELAGARSQSVVPELHHCEVRFAAVPIRARDLIAGDGYADYAKPFRLREDVFVTGCTLAFLLAHGHTMDWPTRWRQRCIAAIVSLGKCAELNPSDPPSQLLAAGALSLAGDVIDQTGALWEQQASAESARWLRDRPILGLGKDARRQRAVSAWERLGWTGP